jgi:predicted nucleotidyltransferase
MNYPETGLDSETKQVLTDLKAAIDRLQVPMLLIGARARLLIFDSQYNVQGRATTDCDVAVQLDNWERYDTLVTEMTAGEAPGFKKTSVIHKFIHLETGLEVDVIPFGNISNQKQEITWNDGNQMSILGLQEAFLNAQIEKIDDIELLIPDIPAFIALKLLAWNERRETKDLEDITFVLQNYQEDERVFEELYNKILEGQVEFDEAAIVLLGRDIQKVFSEQALNKVREIVTQILENQNQYLPRFVPKDLDGNAWDEALDKIVRRFQSLQYGLQDSLA